MRVAVVTDSLFLCEKTMYLGELKTEMKNQGIAIDLFPIVNKPWSTLEGKFPVQRLLGTSLLIPAMRRYDIVHTQFTFPIGSLLSFLDVLHRKPVIIHTHGDDVFVVPGGIGFRRSSIGRLATEISWKAASKIIAVCKKAKEVIVKTGVPPTKINVLYNGVNTNLFRKREDADENKFASPLRKDGDFVFLNVGALKAVKNQTSLLKAFRLFSKESGNNSRLIICGSGHLDKSLHDLSNRLHLEDKVVFAGKVPHHLMPEVYNVADAYILPSLHEAHPWSLLEAMSCELPATASKVGGIPETINNEHLVFNPWKINEIAESMRYLAENPKRSRNIGAQNRKTVLDKFTIEHHTAQLKSIYLSVLQHH